MAGWATPKVVQAWVARLTVTLTTGPLQNGDINLKLLNTMKYTNLSSGMCTKPNVMKGGACMNV